MGPSVYWNTLYLFVSYSNWLLYKIIHRIDFDMFKNRKKSISLSSYLSNPAQSAGAVEFTDYVSTEG